MAGDNPARVLGAEGPLERRLAQIAELGEHAMARASPRVSRPAPVREEESACATSAITGCAGETPDGALDGLARADARDELVPPETRAREVAARVADPCRWRSRRAPSASRRAASRSSTKCGHEEADVERRRAAAARDPSARARGRRAAGRRRSGRQRPAGRAPPTRSDPGRGSLSAAPISPAAEHQAEACARRSGRGNASRSVLDEPQHRRHRHDEAAKSAQAGAKTISQRAGSATAAVRQPSAQHRARALRAAAARRCDRSAAGAAGRTRAPGGTPRSRKSGHSVSVTYISVYASCQRKKLRMRISPLVRMSRSGSGNVRACRECRRPCARRCRSGRARRARTARAMCARRLARSPRGRRS